MYAMVGSASMLCGFKQMAVAVVVFITGKHKQREIHGQTQCETSFKLAFKLGKVCKDLLSCCGCLEGAANDLGLVPPLMLAAGHLGSFMILLSGAKMKRLSLGHTLIAAEQADQREGLR